MMNYRIACNAWSGSRGHSGKLVAATTSYIVIDVSDVEPVDTTGQEALRKPQPQVMVEDVAAYDALIVAGQRLTKEVREAGTNKLLTPPEAYAPHTMSPMGVLYARCREGYEMDSGTIMPPEVGLCVAGICGFPVEPRQVKVLKMRCVKAEPFPAKK